MEITRQAFEQMKEKSFIKGTIVTGSMHPVIKVGDEITILVGEQNLKRFDIVVFYMDDKLICHYLWAQNKIISPFLLQTRSLLGKKKDLPITRQECLGKVISHKLNFYWRLRLFLKLVFQ